MKKCPKCGSGAQRTNLSNEIFANIIGFGAGVLATPFGPSFGPAAYSSVKKNICDCKRFKCTNPKCNHEWYE